MQLGPCLSFWNEFKKEYKLEYKLEHHLGYLNFLFVEKYTFNQIVRKILFCLKIVQNFFLILRK